MLTPNISSFRLGRSSLIVDPRSFICEIELSALRSIEDLGNRGTCRGFRIEAEMECSLDKHFELQYYLGDDAAMPMYLRCSRYISREKRIK